jgi:ABC-type amino acid transport substrate-binding protein
VSLSPAQREWIAAHPRVVYALAPDYGPFVYTDEQGRPRGLSVDVLTLIAQKTGLAFEPGAALSLPANLALAERGEIDIVTSLRPTRERAAYMDFTPAYVTVPSVLMVRDGTPRAQGLRAMAGRRVAVGAGFAVERFVRERYPQVNWVPLADDAESLAQLAAGRVDGAVADLASAHFIALEKGLPNNWPVLRMAGDIGYDYPLSFGYRKDAPLLGEILQRGLQAITVDERAALMRRWMPRPTDGGWSFLARPPLLAAAALLLCGCACAALGWRRRTAGDRASAPGSGASA